MIEPDRDNTPFLTIVLADSELELVPEPYWHHPSVSINAKKRKKRSSKVLLDTNLHHSVFKDPAERNRRGRPDIVHQFLLIGLESILNIEGGMEVFVHTRNDELITISGRTRMPKNFNRFNGLFEELFRTGAVPSGKDPLIELFPDMNLISIIERAKMSRPKMENTVVLMHERGKPVSSYEMMAELSAESGSALHLIAVMGGFPSGDFRTDTSSMKNRYSLHNEQLKAWAVEMEIISSFYNLVFRGTRTSEEA